MGGKEEERGADEGREKSLTAVPPRIIEAAVGKTRNLSKDIEDCLPDEIPSQLVVIHILAKTERRKKRTQSLRAKSIRDTVCQPVCHPTTYYHHIKVTR